MRFELKNLYLSNAYGARRLLHEISDKGWKLGSIDSLLKRSHEMGRLQLSGNQSAADRIRHIVVD